MPLWDKMRTIAREIYGAEDIIADQRVRDQFKEYQAAGLRPLPDLRRQDPVQLLDRPQPARARPPATSCRSASCASPAGPSSWSSICGEIMTMPGLPKAPAAERIRLDEQGQIEGLF